MWPGDPALADPAKLPDFHWNDATEWVGEGGTFYKLRCDYRLVVDNLMDLTHKTYVQATPTMAKAVVAAMKMIPTDDPLFGKGMIRVDGRSANTWSRTMEWGCRRRGQRRRGRGRGP